MKIRGYLIARYLTLAALLGAPAGASYSDHGMKRAALDAAPVSITVSLDQTVAAYKPLFGWFGYDEANYTTMPNGLGLLHELHDISPTPVYIRTHNLLTSGSGIPDLKRSSTNVYHEDSSGAPQYNFQILDGIFDAYEAAGVRPLVELGFMPRDLAEISSATMPTSAERTPWKNVPKDYARWGELVRAVTTHLVNRYGSEAVRTWYFEVWNEPDVGYANRNPAEYCKLYDYAVAGVRAVLPDLRVGGPATTGPGDKAAAHFLKRFLHHLNSGRSAATGGRVPVNFVSFHVKGKTEMVGGHLQMDLSHELVDADRGFALLNEYARIRRMPVILSEADPEGCAACSSETHPANDYRNGALYAAYTAAAYKSLFELQDQRHVTLISMLTWSFEFENRKYFEGFRTLSTNGIDKPILNFFRMAALLKGERVSVHSDGRLSIRSMLHNGTSSAPDVDALATKGTREAAVLAWNYRDRAVDGTACQATFHLKGFPANTKRVLLMNYRIDEAHSNAYTLWRAMGMPQDPTPEQVQQLKSRAGLELLYTPKWLEVRKGSVQVEMTMPSESVSLLQLTW